MNREIKFRAFSYLDKVFYYWDYTGTDYPSGVSGGISDPCQFIGIKDKNGKDIYEGDIVKYSSHKGYLLKDFIGEIIFIESCAAYGYKTKEDSYEIPFAEYDEPKHDVFPHLEVIGNIHENHVVKRNYSEKYDAYYNIETNEWLEESCNHPDCEFCKERPIKYEP